jgi:hypothetical protein
MAEEENEYDFSLTGNITGEVWGVLVEDISMIVFNVGVKEGGGTPHALVALKISSNPLPWTNC